MDKDVDARNIRLSDTKERLISSLLINCNERNQAVNKIPWKRKRYLKYFIKLFKSIFLGYLMKSFMAV